MICSHCGSALEPGQRFCPNCGQRVEPQGCASCGQPLPDGARFCPSCGTPTEPSVAAAATAPDRATAARPQRPGTTTERRLVSILFVDLVGFTPASERRDAEETRELLDRYFALANERIGRYGGTIEKFIGDAVMAVWGTPVAHEDDAERAVRAGLDLVEAVPSLVTERQPASGTSTPAAPALQARGAVMTGEAAVDTAASGQAMVAGDLVNTTARLQAAAQPGWLLVDEATRRATSGAIAYEAVDAMTLKGKESPVEAHRALRIVAGRGGAGRSTELEPPFVGRDSELSLLKELLHATSREGRLRAISVTGQAGIGKSRLLWELEKYIDGLVEPVYWHQGRSPAYGEGVTYWALGEMVRRRAGLLESADDETTRQRLAETLAQYVADEQERRRVEPTLLALLGLEEPGHIDRNELFAAWRLFFERIAGAGTTVLVFEDLQWADPGLIDFIEHLLTWSRGVPVLVVTLARPDLLERRPTWGAGQRNFTSLHLEPLADEPMRRLLEGLLPGIPQAAARSILARAEGVPLYAVETVRMLVADGTVVAGPDGYRLARPLAGLSVPQTLHALVAARLDGLEDGDRSLLQDGAVCGQSFSVEAVAAISGLPQEELTERFDRLVRAELLRVESDPRSPERGQYQFVQGVIREVAYATLSKRERKDRHLAAARYYEGLGDEELAGALARHYLDAYRAAPEGSEADALAAQARVALRGAAERAAALRSYQQARAFLDLSLEVTPDEAEQAGLRERAAFFARHAGQLDGAMDYLRAAMDWHRAQGDSAAAARLTGELGAILVFDGQVEQAKEALQRALDELDGKVPEADLAGIVDQLGRAWYLGGENERALELIDRALAAAEPADLQEIAIDAIITKGSILVDTRPQEGQAMLFGAAELARNRGSELEMRALNNLMASRTGEGPRANHAIQQAALETARRLGNRPTVQKTVGSLAFDRFLMADWDGALEALTEIADQEAAVTNQLEVAWLRSDIAAARDDVAMVEREAAERKRLLVTLTNPGYHSGDHLAAAWVAAMAGRYDESLREARLATDESNAPDRAWMSGAAAVHLGDVGALRRILEEEPPEAWRGLAATGAHSVLTAALAGLEGDTAAAAAGFRAGLRALRDSWSYVQALETQIIMVRVLGAESPDGRIAASEAAETIERLRAPALRRLLDRAINEGVMAATRAANLADPHDVSAQRQTAPSTADR